MNNLFWLFALLLVLAAVLRSELFFYLLYVLVALQLISRWWLRRGTNNLRWQRNHPQRAFPGEVVTVELAVSNGGLLPLPWLAIQESVAAPLRQPPTLREVVALGAGEQHTLRYQIAARNRGYYWLGPLQLRSGDVLGLEERGQQEARRTAITIFPEVLPLSALGLPATLPFGALASHEPLFADPARPSGARPYTPSDGVRRIDWKNSARVGQLQVRRYDPAVAAEVLIALAFSRDEYAGRYAYDEMERAVVAAASLASDIAMRRQAVGLCSNGGDAASGGRLDPVAVGRGREHLYQVLAALGRLVPGAAGPLLPLLWAASAQLSWGSTVAIVTGQPTSALLEAVLMLKRRGLHVALLQIEATPTDLALARRHGVTAYRVDRRGQPVAL
jgi:uncharacterized protein (DUF58 family)